MIKDKPSHKNKSRESTIDDVFDVVDQVAIQAESNPDAQKMIESAAQKIESSDEYKL